MNNPEQYDFIVAGSGCAGLSLLVHLVRSGKFGDKRILLVDRDIKDRNDRTWCFWESGEGLFEPVVSKSWKDLWFRSSKVSRLLDLRPYSYKLIRGIDFYNYALSVISGQPGIVIRQANVDEAGEDERGAYIRIGGQRIGATFVFNSILFEKPVLARGAHYLLQHFKGWTIETSTDVFNPAEATLMDFRVDQRHGTAFVYVMPFTKRTALVEYTLFTGALLTDEQYDAGLTDYVERHLGISGYHVSGVEQGIIPMTDHRFPRGSAHVINMGTAGGSTRGSTGYTFQFIQKHAAAIVQRLVNDEPLQQTTPVSKRRYDFYDSVLLDVLDRGAVPGSEVFSRLFRRNDPRKVLRFLDKDSSLGEDLAMIASLPVGPFLKAAWRSL